MSEDLQDDDLEEDWADEDDDGLGSEEDENMPGAVGPDGTFGMSPIPGDAIFIRQGIIEIYSRRLSLGTRYFFYANNQMYFAERFFDHVLTGKIKPESIAMFEEKIGRKIPRSDIDYEYRIEVR